MLINTESTLEVFKIYWEVILVIIILTTAFFIFAICFGIKAQGRKPVAGIEGIIGETGEAISNLEPEGQIRIHGELWNAEIIDGLVSTLKRTKVF